MVHRYDLIIVSFDKALMRFPSLLLHLSFNGPSVEVISKLYGEPIKEVNHPSPQLFVP